MKVSFVFPGQGSQMVGMGADFVDAFPEFKHVMEEIDDTLREPLSHLILNGIPETLTLTSNAQPALLCISMGMVRVIEKQTGKRIFEIGEYAAGHSLGEYTALCAADVFSIAQAGKLVRKRGIAMQEAVPVDQGAMSAILGAEISLIEAIISDVNTSQNICCIANDNCPGQVVVSGHKEAVKLVQDKLKEQGVKRCVDLAVSAPFHSPLMQPAADVMKEELSQENLENPKMNVLMNVTALPLVSKEFIAPLLVEQITARVRWREILLHMQELGITDIVEVGPGKVLTGLAKRTVPDLQLHNISSPQEMEDILKIIL